ncbi:MAG: aspartate racemase [Thermoprotei archaeon]|nr:MAG: aspartate racemase [Thermoprotei archaeon]
MRIIGLIGGVSWHSTLDYYRIINEEVNRRLGGIHSAKILLYSLDLGEIKELQNQGRREDVEKILVDAAKKLERGGADFGLICANTLHMYFDAISRSVSIPFIHIADATAEKIREVGLKRVGLLGTLPTMELGFYRDRLAEHGIEVIVPSREDRVEVDRIIFEELVVGKFLETSKKRLVDIIDRLVEMGAEGVILGCTELPLILRNAEVDIPLFDTTRIHALKAVELSLG